MTDLKWEEPTTVRGRSASAEHAEIASALRSRPEQWAVVLESENVRRAYDLAACIRYARLVAYRPEGAFEAATRSGQDGEPAKVYARYVGEPE